MDKQQAREADPRWQGATIDRLRALVERVEAEAGCELRSIQMLFVSADDDMWATVSAPLESIVSDKNMEMWAKILTADAKETFGYLKRPGSAS